MMVLKRLALAAALSLTACSAQLATLPPNDNYTMVESDPPRLTDDERQLVDDINKELNKLGLPTATVGGYEQNVAAIMANAALAKVWHGSARAIAQQNPQEIAPQVSGQEQSQAKHEVGNGRLASLTDEEDDTKIKHLHAGQHMTAHGIPLSVRLRVLDRTYAETRLASDDIKNLTQAVRPNSIHGELKIGVAILPVGDADKRLFVVALRDRAFDLTRGPPRYGTPGATFDVAGTLFGRELSNMKLALLGPDGKTQLKEAPVDAQGNFSTTMSLSNAPGLYLFSATHQLGSEQSITVPIFAGIQATPWPVTPDPNETPVEGTRTLVVKAAKAIAEWRHSHGLPTVPVDASLSAYSKSDATVGAKAVDDSAGDGSGTPWTDFQLHVPDRMRAAGIDPAHTHFWFWTLPPDYVNDFFARFPESGFLAAQVGSPTLRAIGLGAVLVPNIVTDDSDNVRYFLELSLDDPTPPSYESRNAAKDAANPPMTVTVRADGSASVDGAQVDDARLKQAIDTAKSTNADLTVLLQVEDGAKPEVVQHVTEVIKAEGVVNLVTNAASPSAPPPPPGTTPPAPAKTPPPTTSPPPGNW